MFKMKQTKIHALSDVEELIFFSFFLFFPRVCNGGGGRLFNQVFKASFSLFSPPPTTPPPQKKKFFPILFGGREGGWRRVYAM